MKLRLTTAADDEAWPGCQHVTLGAPAGREHDVAPAEILAEVVNLDVVRHVPWLPDEADLEALANGATVWLTVMGGLPPHRIEVR